jgi:transposase
MDAIDKLKQDVRDGCIDAERLVDVIAAQQRQLQSQQHELQAAKQRIAELEQKLGPAAAPATVKVEQSFSVQAEEKRQQARGKHNQPKLWRRGRLHSADKIKLAQRTESCYPQGVPQQDCQLSHTRPVWRLEEGRAVLVAYAIYRGPNRHYGQIPGVLGRCEFGMEILVQIAFLIYVMGLSFDKVCVLLHFLQNLPLRKSQADALLTRLARHWQQEFDVLCTLLANSLVVHTDETSWSINSVWVFLSEKARVLFFGVHKDAETLKEILDPQSFAVAVHSVRTAIWPNLPARSGAGTDYMLRNGLG